EVLKVLGLQYDIKFPENNAYGDELPNGTWTGMISMLQKEAANLAFTYISITQERSKVVGFSKTYSYSARTTENSRLLCHSSNYFQVFFFNL
ncbi:hypothetical protein NPIL_261471, partial [Nephila pilipes]